MLGKRLCELLIESGQFDKIYPLKGLVSKKNSEILMNYSAVEVPR